MVDYALVKLMFVYAFFVDAKIIELAIAVNHVICFLCYIIVQNKIIIDNTLFTLFLQNELQVDVVALVILVFFFLNKII